MLELENLISHFSLFFRVKIIIIFFFHTGAKNGPQDIGGLTSGYSYNDFLERIFRLS